MWRAGTGWRILFRSRNALNAQSFIACSGGCSRVCKKDIVPHRSVAGFGVAGPFGPRTGSSSGTLPGNSRGGGGAPGSCMGGGTSGRGLPGGSSRGGSVGVPGVGGGISGGSMGIPVNGTDVVMFQANIRRGLRVSHPVRQVAWRVTACLDAGVRQFG